MVEEQHYITGKPGMVTCPFGEKLQPFWDLRYEFFELFDYGIQIDRGGLLCAKPERVTHELASRIRGNRVLDVYCGLGMSSIACARAGKQVVCVDSMPGRIDLAKHNAQIYGISKQLTFVCADPREVMREAKQREFDAVILDPPLSNPLHAEESLLKLESFSPPAHQLLKAAASCAGQIAFMLPLKFDLNELKQFAHHLQIDDALVGDDVRYRTALLWN